MRKRVVELILLAIAVGLTVEVIKPAIPYLPAIWLVILAYYTWEAASTNRVLSYANRIKTRLSGRRLMYSYGLVAIFGAGLFTLYWWGLNSFFAPKIAAYEAEQRNKNHQTLTQVDSITGRVEVRIIKRLGFSAFWIRWQGQCVITPIDALLFMRVTNAMASNIVITAYEIESKEGNTWIPIHRLDMRSGYVLHISSATPAVAGKGKVGGVLNYPSGVYHVSLVGNLNYRDSSVLELPIFEDAIGGKNLPPHESASGWVAINYADQFPSLDSDIRLTVTDAANRSYSVTSKIEDSMDRNNVVPHLMKIVGFDDVSGCKQEMISP